MSDFAVLSAVRGHLIHKKISERVHLALPPRAIYPLVLVELEEAWTFYPPLKSKGRKGIQARVKFKVSICSQAPGIEEATELSDQICDALEGAKIPLSGGWKSGATAILRLLECQESERISGGNLRRIMQVYESIVRR